MFGLVESPGKTADSEGRRLAELSAAIRESSIKRLRQVPTDLEGWRIDPEALSFADLAHHLIAADRWLFDKLADPELPPMVARTGEAPEGWNAYLSLLDQLEATGRQRYDLLAAMSDERLTEPISDSRFDGGVAVWWTIVRGNLDHEIHHRGQLTVYLRVACQ